MKKKRERAVVIAMLIGFVLIAACGHEKEAAPEAGDGADGCSGERRVRRRVLGQYCCRYACRPFDAEGVSFVAVTQQFNTTTSMGRLTLNVLLSFAQFEREVTGERIRDKIAASKQKGMWMGGTVPLGYDLSDHRLVVNETEAETVRLIFQLYVELKTVRRVSDELDRRSIVSKQWVSEGAIQHGGFRFRPGALYHLLANLVPMKLRRRGVETRMVIPGEAVTATRTDPALLRALARGHRWFGELASGRAASTKEIADREGLSASYVRHVVPLGLLAPAIVESICAGQQSVSLSAERLKDHANLPIEWDAQQQLLSD
jgi:resolvase-like protein